MSTPFNVFLTFVFSAGLLASAALTNASAGPVIDWVTPPAWLQTGTENTPALPGTALSVQTWISTGRGGKALVVIGGEQVEIDENSVWEWSGLDDGNTGNTIQGGMRVSTSQNLANIQTQTTEIEQAARFYRRAPWILLLDAGNDQAAALKLVDFLKNSGYPVKAAQQVQPDNGAKWQIWLEGLPSKDASMAVGIRLRALAPAILSASPELKEAFKMTEPKW